MRPLLNLTLEEVAGLTLLLIGVVGQSFFATTSSSLVERSNYAVARVEGMCSEFIASSVLRELEKVPGVIGMTPDVRCKSVRLEIHATRPASPKAIWEAIERSPVRPVRLVMDGDSFSERPLE